MQLMTGPLLLVLLGVSIVVCGILWLRWPAFLALILAAMAVGAATGIDVRERYFLELSAVSLGESVDGRLYPLAAGSKAGSVGERYAVLVFNEQARRWEELTQGTLVDLEGIPDAVAPRMLKCDVSLSTELTAPLRAITLTEQHDALRKARASLGHRVSSGFGEACLSLGIIIAMASIIGTCLMESGAADRIVRSLLAWTGEPRAALAFAGSGFVLGIPVFFDTVFLLMIPLGKALYRQTGKNYLLYVLTIICGATMAHSLVPPTPGPLAVGRELGVELGTMIFAGLIVGLGTTLAGLLWALWLNRFTELPLREIEPLPTGNPENLASSLPPLWLALLPIALPVLLIGGKSILEQWAGVWRTAPGSWQDVLREGILLLGEPPLALTFAACVAIVMLRWQRRLPAIELGSKLRTALSSGGEILLVTAAGGAFGLMLRQTGIAGLFTGSGPLSAAQLCAMSFLVTVAIRAAQGSATVAMMTAAGILSGLAREGGLPCHPVYLALAIGCGSKPGMWMNDSGFLVITRMSGMTDVEGLRFVTSLTTVMGIAGLLLTMLGASVWPQLGAG
jgi:GntP family gluconate:H+ symporter